MRLDKRFFKGAAASSRRPKNNARLGGENFLQLAIFFITFADGNINKTI